MGNNNSQKKETPKETKLSSPPVTITNRQPTASSNYIIIT